MISESDKIICHAEVSLMSLIRYDWGALTLPLAILSGLHFNAGAFNSSAFILQFRFYVPQVVLRCPFELIFSFCSNLNIRCFAGRIAEMMDCAYPTISRSENDPFRRTLIT
jgi:hypothetical protein